MHSEVRSHNSAILLRPAHSSLAIPLNLLLLIFIFLLTTFTAIPAQPQTFSVLYNFTGGPDGMFPEAGLTIDAGGNLFGTTYLGPGNTGKGTVFEFSTTGQPITLHSLAGGSDGAYPFSKVIFGPDGDLYGTTLLGGAQSCGRRFVRQQDCGTVFDLSPATRTERVIEGFSGVRGYDPGTSAMVFDRNGNMYGTTSNGGRYGGACGVSGCGTVYQLTRGADGWTETTIYNFEGGTDGMQPVGVIVDSAGNLYGTTTFGGNSGCYEGSCGVIFELTPSPSGWIEKVIHAFQPSIEGGNTIATVVMDHAGNLYGTSGFLGSQGCIGAFCGTLFQLSPSSGGWTSTVLHKFERDESSWAPLSIGPNGGLYGTTFWNGANGGGSVFKMTRSGNTWTFTSLHDFAGRDGWQPVSDVVFDADGNLYGTASLGGYGSGCPNGCGVIWKITP